ncbi:MAG: hypothetical protein AMXMBFR84_10130 [Candidatus Hydrogenedentota bacterium]
MVPIRKLWARGVSVLLLGAAAGVNSFVIQPGAGSVSAQVQTQVRVPLEGKPFKKLSEYGFFAGDGSAQQPNEGVLPYDLTTPLFSDYSTKFRFVWMPTGSSATYSAEDPFTFPVGSVLIKTFGFEHDLRDPSQGRRLIETRLLVHRPEGWTPYIYIWNEEQTDADLKVAGGRRMVEWTHFDGGKRSLNYVIPNLNQCKGCHISGETIIPIGPKGRNLNRDYAYANGVENQLLRWAEAGYLTGSPEPKQADALPVWDDPTTGTLAERARAYLDVNCAHCHSPKGPANTTGVDLRFQQLDPHKWGVEKVPVAAGRGSGDRRFGIVPGKPDESIMIYRLESTEPGIMMPELPRLTVHEEGAALLRQWITEMPK